MKVLSEKAIERKLKDAITKTGGWSIKLLSIYVKGLPDRLCIMPGGNIFFTEIKTTGKKPTKMQKRIASKLKALGCDVYLIDNLEEMHRIVKAYEESKQT